ncbi:hypothetical protein Glove_199g141 [Diversispora epigaea]|uniref:Uncharacterized protein n=1 Tax=Diversispora epigaea TaxID=1348612 RepID=A0A397IRF1_9GLOM|nr:hypothetical protein Glove_199g141 [Diversispora epigaea]
MLAKLKNYNEALIDFDKSLEIQPSFIESLEIQPYNRDLHEENIGKYSGIEPNNALALRLRGKALEKESNNIFALRSRGETYRMLEKYNKPLIDFNHSKVTSHGITSSNDKDFILKCYGITRDPNTNNIMIMNLQKMDVCIVAFDLRRNIDEINWQ